MRSGMTTLAAMAALAALTTTPASAEVFQKSETGFVVRQLAEVSAAPVDVWTVLVAPATWWNAEHSWSGDAANMSLDPRAGGCFCEVLPSKVSPRASPRGGVEHMRVVYAEDPRALRMVGALGPLQSEAVNAVLTVSLKPADGGGTRIQWEYVVGGYMRYKVDQIAPAVDGMLADQLLRLAGKLGPRKPAEAPQAPAKPPESTDPGR